ncbi:hypothetical protein CIHG_00688 [Coccidioides immitis H538.4]|uniref:Retrotransposon gag domain-containing protein n=1 Tax=Coccidioides immitis H538.4 TaxID=396776 RepID=A0A0J8RE94_COCIT|nr:hypothetical protein CIHG_00688 [Coccidioides immitis H538.4]
MDEQHSQGLGAAREITIFTFCHSSFGDARQWSLHKEANPETREPGTPAENQPEEPPTLVHKETTNPDTSTLSTVDETKTSMATSEREPTEIAQDGEEVIKLREKIQLLESVIRLKKELNALEANDRKHSRSESLDAATSNTTPAKRSSVLRLPQYAKLYKTGSYTEYRRFTSNIEFIRDANALNNEQTLAYALIGLDYIEKDLWEVHREQNPSKNNWNGLKEFLLAKSGDSLSRTRNAWRKLFSLRKSSDETDYAYLQRYREVASEIGEEFEDPVKLKKNLFIWSLDKPMRTKLDEQLEIPDSIDEIVALATRLRPGVLAAHAKARPYNHARQRRNRG